MDNVTGRFGSSYGPCGTRAVPHGPAVDTSEVGAVAERSAHYLIIIVVVLTNLILAVRGEDLVTVIGFAACVLTSAAALTRLLAPRRYR